MRNRYLIAAAAVAIHLSIGSVYAYSVLKKPLGAELGWQDLAVTGSFSLAIVFLGLSAAFLGPFVEKYGPRVAGTTAGVLYGSGMLVAGLACYLNILPLFYIGYGVLGGIGLGVGYIAPVSTLVKYFPERRGLATGLAIMGFGFGALLYSPVMNYLLATIGAAGMFWVLGAWYMLIMVSVSQYLQRPPENYGVESGPNAAAHKKLTTAKTVSGLLGQMTVGEALRTPQFYGLWIMLFINVTCGIAVISAASPLLQENVGLTAAAAAGVTGLLGLFNGVGRIAWASASDFMGRTATYATFFLIQIIAFATLPTIQSALAFQIVLFLILTCYGGGFATIPAFIGDLFGTKQLGAIHGCVLTAWSAAGLVGPLAYAWLRDSTGSIASAMYLFAGLFVIALVTAVVMGVSIRKRFTEQFPAQLTDANAGAERRKMAKPA